MKNPNPKIIILILTLIVFSNFIYFKHIKNGEQSENKINANVGSILKEKPKTVVLGNVEYTRSAYNIKKSETVQKVKNYISDKKNKKLSRYEFVDLLNIFNNEQIECGSLVSEGSLDVENFIRQANNFIETSCE